MFSYCNKSNLTSYSSSRNVPNISTIAALSDLTVLPLDSTAVLKEEKSDKPREGRVGKTPFRGENGKFMSKGVWLDNNYLTGINGIEQFINNLLEYPEKLSWIDFSFNNIKEIDHEIIKFQNLLILYLHGNDIDNIDTIIKLRNLPKLKRLSTHGNPVCDIPNYRISIIHLIPQLYNLDFAPVIKRERFCQLPPNMVKKLQSVS